MNTDFEDNELDSVEELCPSVSMFVSLLQWISLLVLFGQERIN